MPPTDSTDDAAYAEDVKSDDEISQAETLPPLADPSLIPPDEGDAGHA